MSKLRSQPLQHVYSVANHPHGEQAHLCLSVCIFLFANVRVCFFHLQIKYISHGGFSTVPSRASTQKDNKHSQLYTRKNRVKLLHMHANLCLSCLFSFHCAEGVNHNFSTCSKGQNIVLKNLI